jgi:hypothetical protein
MCPQKLTPRDLSAGCVHKQRMARFHSKNLYKNEANIKSIGTAQTGEYNSMKNHA